MMINSGLFFILMIQICSLEASNSIPAIKNSFEIERSNTLNDDAWEDKLLKQTNKYNNKEDAFNYEIIPENYVVSGMLTNRRFFREKRNTGNKNKEKLCTANPVSCLIFGKYLMKKKTVAN